ncbi:hypothetical protein ACHOLT_08000 [Desulfitobacterium sp. Sab5]|uniref:hypothetical protein n=1 Tax=Desulfitobacterium nosdiversum TaxID=3375356 RepID=UPI003CEC3344
MKSILYTELASDFLVQGLGLNTLENAKPTAKVGRHEVELVRTIDELIAFPVETQVIYIGTAKEGPFRAGDVLMSGSDELLDRAFKALDEIEQRGIVVGLSHESDSHQVTLAKEELSEVLQDWKERKISYLCLFLVEPFESDGTAKLVSTIRKIFV